MSETTELHDNDGEVGPGVQARTTTAPDGDEGGLLAWRMLRLGLLVAAIVALGVTQGVSMLIVVAAIVIMIFLHELGHFVMARRAGMLATEFFIGFGPRIFSFRRGETEYGLKAIPAGAYVRIIGMSSLEDVDPALESRTYRQKSFWQRIGVAVAGSAMHFMIAFVLLFAQAALVGVPMAQRWKVGGVTEGSAAQAAGLQIGDEIVAFDGKPVKSFDSFRNRLSGIEPGQVQLTVDRDGSSQVIPVDLSTRLKIIGTVGEDIDVVDTGDHLILGVAGPGSVAAEAGLVPGSTLTAIDGQPVSGLPDVKSAIADVDSGTVELSTVGPSGTASTSKVDLGSAVATTKGAAFVGVGEAPVLGRQGPLEAVWTSTKTFGAVSKASVVGVGQFIWPPNMVRFVTDTLRGSETADPTDKPTPAEATPLGAESKRPISIIGVAKIGSDLSSQSLANLLQFLALINIFFGVFNLFPMLPFDGGHVVIAVYERFCELRRGTSQRYLSDVSRIAPIAYVVVAVLVVVGLLAMFLDITQGIRL